MRFEVEDIEELVEVAKSIIEKAPTDILTFEGEMGAGKTTLIKAICRELQCVEEANSPTFSIVNEYLSGQGEPVYHFDFYRIEDPEEAMDFGVEEYWDSGHLCLVEWPERVSSILPQAVTVIRIEVVNSTRIIEMETEWPATNPNS